MYSENEILVNTGGLEGMKPTTILFVTLSLSGGGAERVISVLSSELSKRENIDVHVLAFKKKANEYPLEEQVVRHQMENNTYTNKRKRLLYIHKVIKSVKPDYVIPFLNEPTMYVYFAKFGTKTRFISTVRNNPEYYVGRGLRGKLIRYITEHADKCMLQTEEQANYFSWKSTEQYFVVPNPVQDSYFNAERKYARKAKILVALGRLEKQKNYEMMIDVIARIIIVHHDVVLKIYGEGTLKEELQRMIIDKKADKNIFLCGRTNEVPEVLKEADLFVMTSDYEGMPNALMEAMALGVPCVSTSCPTGPKDLICNGVDGYLVPVGERNQYYKTLLNILDNYSDCIACGKMAKEKIRLNYNVDACVNAFLQGVQF
jgi:glycosyltransferase involved in cell wall biosynthesis